MKKLLIFALLLLPGIMLCAQDNNRRREIRPGQGREMRRYFSPEAMAKMETDAINEAVGLDSLQYQLVYILKYSDVAAMQDSMKAQAARREKKRFEWLQHAANNGLMEAQEQVAKCFEKGRGTEHNDKKAYKYYKLAAEQGSEIGKAKAYEFEVLKFYK